MTLDCPGCKSKLKLDPAKLPPGASAAVCPKCRTKILLPGPTGAAEISVQCGRCSSRLKVKVARLKPTASRSKCPKCGGRVDLPAAPLSQSGGGQAASRRGAPAEMDRSAMTRRLDAKEMGVLLGGQGAVKPGSGPAVAADQPIEDAAPPPGAFQSSSTDLGRLIDEKVDALGSGSPPPPQPAARVGEPSVEDLPIEMPPVTDLPDSKVGISAPPPASPGAREPGASSSARSRRPASSSGSRSAPSFGSAIPAASPSGSGRKLPAFMLGGVVGGSVVAAAMVLGGQYLPEGISPPVPEFISELLGGQSLGLLTTMILLSALSGLFASFSLPPEGEGGESGISVFRCAVAAGLVGLLAGVGISMVRGGSDLAAMAMPAASWTVALIISGLLTGLTARIFGSR